MDTGKCFHFPANIKTQIFTLFFCAVYSFRARTSHRHFQLSDYLCPLLCISRLTIFNFQCSINFLKLGTHEYRICMPVLLPFFEFLHILWIRIKFSNRIEKCESNHLFFVFRNVPIIKLHRLPP